MPVGPPNANPTDAEVAAVFDRYVSELRRVFDANKEECLPPDVAARGLEVIVRGKGRAGGGAKGAAASGASAPAPVAAPLRSRL